MASIVSLAPSSRRLRRRIRLRRSHFESMGTPNSNPMHKAVTPAAKINAEVISSLVTHPA